MLRRKISEGTDLVENLKLDFIFLSFSGLNKRHKERLSVAMESTGRPGFHGAALRLEVWEFGEICSVVTVLSFLLNPSSHVMKDIRTREELLHHQPLSIKYQRSRDKGGEGFLASPAGEHPWILLAAHSAALT